MQLTILYAINEDLLFCAPRFHIASKSIFLAPVEVEVLTILGTPSNPLLCN